MLSSKREKEALPSASHSKYHVAEAEEADDLLARVSAAWQQTPRHSQVISSCDCRVLVGPSRAAGFGVSMSRLTPRDRRCRCPQLCSRPSASSRVAPEARDW